MLTNPGTLRLVLRILGPPDAGWQCGPSAREFDLIELDDGGDEPDREPTPFRAISDSETRTINEPDIVRGHRMRNPHWCWISENPRRYPEPPFLLTDNPAHRLVYHGEADLEPTRRLADEIDEGVRAAGQAVVPISGNGWFGAARILGPDPGRGVCWIYADANLRLSGRHDGVISDGIPLRLRHLPGGGCRRVGMRASRSGEAGVSSSFAAKREAGGRSRCQFIFPSGAVHGACGEKPVSVHFSFRGRPRGLGSRFTPSWLALASVQPGAPKGWPVRMECRMRLISSSP